MISAPSGAGKTSIIREVVRMRNDCTFSVSSTTREPRENEREGVDYHFLKREEFIKRIDNGEFAEWAEVHQHLYGTEHSAIMKELSNGKNVILDIDVIGGKNIKVQYPDSLFIFIYPPSYEVLEERLRNRGLDSDEAIQRRLSRYPMEMEMGKQYTHKVVNNNLQEAIDEVMSIIEKEVSNG